MPEPPLVCEWSEIQRNTATTNHTKGAPAPALATVEEISTPPCCSLRCIARGLNLLEQVESCLVALRDPQMSDRQHIQTVQILRDCESTLVKLRKLMSWLHSTGLNSEGNSKQYVDVHPASDAACAGLTADSSVLGLSQQAAMQITRPTMRYSTEFAQESCGGTLSTPLEVWRVHKVSQKDPLAFNEVELQNMPRSIGGQALRHTKGLYLTVQPMISEIRIPDSANGQDFLSKCPHMYALYNMIVIIAMMIVFTFGLFTFWIAAVTAYKYTAESDKHLVISVRGKTVDSHNFVDSIGGQKMQAACTIIHNILLSSGHIALFDAIMSWSYPVMWFIWSENRSKLIGMFVSGLLYSVSAIILVDSPSHVLWMCGRMLLVTTLSFYDASICTFKLRFTEKLFQKNWGAHGKSCRCNPIRFLVICAMLSYGFGDFLRHILVVAQEEMVLVDMGIYHPATQKSMKITMNGIADALFFYSMSLACLTVGEYIEVAWSREADGNELCLVKVGMYIKSKKFAKPFSETVSSTEAVSRNTFSSNANFQNDSSDVYEVQHVDNEMPHKELEKTWASLGTTSPSPKACFQAMPEEQLGKPRDQELQGLVNNVMQQQVAEEIQMQRPNSAVYFTVAV